MSYVVNPHGIFPEYDLRPTDLSFIDYLSKKSFEFTSVRGYSDVNILEFYTKSEFNQFIHCERNEWLSLREDGQLFFSVNGLFFFEKAGEEYELPVKIKLLYTLDSNDDSFFDFFVNDEKLTTETLDTIIKSLKKI